MEKTTAKTNKRKGTNKMPWLGGLGTPLKVLIAGVLIGGTGYTIGRLSGGVTFVEVESNGIGLELFQGFLPIILLIIGVLIVIKVVGGR